MPPCGNHMSLDERDMWEAGVLEFYIIQDPELRREIEAQFASVSDGSGIIKMPEEWREDNLAAFIAARSS